MSFVDFLPGVGSPFISAIFLALVPLIAAVVGTAGGYAAKSITAAKARRDAFLSRWKGEEHREDIQEFEQRKQSQIITAVIVVLIIIIVLIVTVTLLKNKKTK
ncbi:MAG: hypothetical protein ISS18_15200 [Bacteroidales bacterium]|nr:hypothetical protein [Bacteroidales bacterium]